jgi:hypothetical protein
MPELSQVVADRLAGDANQRPVWSMEYLLTSQDGFGLDTASPLQRAICRVLDGSDLGDLAVHPDVVEAFGSTVIPSQPKELAIMSGIRTAKSLIAAGRAVQQTQTCDVSGMVVGEVPRVSVLSLKKDLAQVIFGYVCGLCSRPAIRSRVIGEPTTDTIVLRHPTGRPVEIKVAAGARAGASLVGRWCAGVIFDEAPRMVGAEDGVINLDDAIRAVRGRMLPGSTILYPGSPWAPFGPMYDMHRKHFGQPTSDVCVVHAPGWLMNPVLWTPEKCADLKARDPETYATDVAAEFADKVLSFMSSDAVEHAIQNGTTAEQPQDGWEYVAAMDPATRGNAWTIGVAAMAPNGIRRLVYARQWQGATDSPLSPGLVFEQIAQALRPYRVTRISTDQWSFDALSEIAAMHGIYLDVVQTTQQTKVDWFTTLRALLVDKRVTFVDVQHLSSDLRRVQRRVTQSGVSIELPSTNDGRHCDYAAMLALLFSRYMPEPTRIFERQRSVEERIEARLIEQQTQDDPWGGDDDL